MAKKGEVVVQEQGQLAAFSDEKPAWLGNGPARGNEAVAREDMVIPRLEIVQSQSPIKETDPNVREGMMFNSASSEVYESEVYVIPVFFRKEYLVWKDKEKGGGFFGAFPSEALAQERRNEAVQEDDEDPEDIEVVDTPVHYCLLVKPGDPQFCQQIVISMAKTKAKVSRKWNSLIEMFGGDRFSRVYKLTTFTDENKKGQKFKNFVVQGAGYPPEQLYRAAEKLYDAVKSGLVRAGHEQVVEGEEVSRGEI